MPKLAAPSPLGTNREGLFLNPRGGALDAAPRRRSARDAADPDAMKTALSALQGHLQSKLSPVDANAANTLIEQLLQAAQPDDTAQDDDPDPSQQSFEDDDGTVSDRKRRKIAGDDRTRFPSAVEVAGGGMGLDSLSRQRRDARPLDTSAAETEFVAQFPGSSKPRLA